MRIRPPKLVPSPESPDRMRLTARVEYDNRLIRPEEVWFESDRSLEDQASAGGNPWLLAMLPLAMVRGEALEIEADVDAMLLKNAAKMQSTWASWYPQFVPVLIHAHGTDHESDPGPKTGAFFSGGVDSFYTVLHSRAKDPSSIDELIFVQGADISLGNRAALRRAQASAQRAAQDLGLPLVTVATNLRLTRFRQVHWDYMGSGPLLGAVGLELERRYGRLLISSTWSGEALHPLGSHPEIDPLFSTRSTTVIHYGDWADRIPKTEYIGQFPEALAHLRVCWESQKGENCGRCLKCMRTMAVLEIIGKLNACAAFTADRLDLSSLRRLYLGREWRYYKHLLPYARAAGRDDVAEAIEGAFETTARLDRWLLLGPIQRARERMRSSPAAREWFAPSFHKLRRAAAWIYQRLPRRG